MYTQLNRKKLSTWIPNLKIKVSFFVQCAKMHLITLQNFHIQTLPIDVFW